MPDAEPDTHASPLRDRHAAAGAELVVEDGWTVPRHYGDPDAETRAAHDRAVAFDLSHVGRIRIRGDGALELLERACTADVVRQEDDTAAYTLLLDADARPVDHGLLARLDGQWLLTCSPSRRSEVLSHLTDRGASLGAKVSDQTARTAMLAVVGPEAPAILDAVLPEPPSAMPRRAARTGSMFLARYIAMRTGATKLWSLEVVLPTILAGQAWDFITARAGKHAVRPAGTAAWDRLRVEAGLPRWGRELDRGTDPTDPPFANALRADRTFLGADALPD